MTLTLRRPEPTTNSVGFPLRDLLERIHGIDDDCEQDPDYDEDNIPEDEE